MSAPRRNRGWLWFMLLTFGLAAVACTALVVYNLRQQLKPEDLDKAWALWKEKGPADYDLIYTVGKLGSATEKYVVKVRSKKTEFVSLNGKPLEDRLLPYYGMDELFGQLSEFLRRDVEPGKPRVYCRAVFDPEDGHVCWYVRSVMGKQERLEINVLELRPMAPKTSK
jgi:hypothetical protein